MLIAEDLLLLLCDDETGKLSHTSYLDVGIGGSLLVELALDEHVEVGPKEGLWRRAKVHPTGAAAPSDPVLGEALAVVAEKERTAQELVTRLGKHRRETLLERLVQAGILRREEGRALGLFPRDRWPAVDSDHEAGVRRALGDALLRGQAPEPRLAGLVAVLSAMDLAHKVIDREGAGGREVKARAKEIAEGDWAAKGVRDAIAAAQSAMIAVTAAASTTAATSSS